MGSEWIISEFNAVGVNLRGKHTGQSKTQCPFCSATRKNKNDPSLSVNIDTGAYTCHHCGKSGNIHKYRPKETNYVRPVWKNKTDLSDNLVKWFKKRGISQSTLINAKITEQTEWMPQVEKEVNVVCFNYFKEGELINVKYRDGAKNFKMFKDAEKIWYNHDAIHNEELIIVEGEIDALSFIEIGLDNVVSVPNGAKNYDFFDLDTLEKIKRFYIAVDNDTAGLQLQSDLVRRIGAERCAIVDFEDCKDANEYLVKYDPEKLRQQVIKAKDVPVSGILYVHDYVRELADMYEHGLRPGLKIRHGKLSEHITFETGRLLIITGIPGHGKSEFVDEITTDMSVIHNWKTGYFSPENWPVQLHISKLMAKITGNWIQNLRPDELDMCATFLDEHFFWVMPEDEEPTLETILTKAEYLIKKYGIRCFVIDPWNTIEFQLNGMTETQYINKALSTLGTFCKRMDILIILVAHPIKMQKTEGVYDVPNLYSINGSSHFYNKADYGITIYRVQSTDDVQIHIQKVKFRHLGHTGMVEFRNNHNNGRYHELTGGALVSWDNANRLVNENDQNYLGGSQPDAF